MKLKPIKRISYKTIVDYITCPLKLYLYGTKDSKLTYQEYYSWHARESLYTFFNAIGMGRSYAQASSTAIDKFTNLWQSNLGRLMATKNIVMPEKTIFSLIRSMYDPNKDEIVAIKYPLDMSVSKTLILEDCIDIFLIHREKGYMRSKTTYRGIVLEDQSIFDNKRYQMMRASFFKLALQRHIGRDDQKSYKLEIRSFNGSDVLINPEPKYLPIIYSLMANVIKSIESGAVYPTNNKEACKACSFRDICNLSLVRS